MNPPLPPTYLSYVEFCRKLQQEPMDYERWWRFSNEKIGHLNASAPIDYIGQIGYW